MLRFKSGMLAHYRLFSSFHLALFV